MTQNSQYPTPGFNDVVRYKGGGLSALPDVPHPYYILAKNNLFMHVRLGDLGRGIIHQYGGPKMFQDLELEWQSDGNPVPNDLCKQIWSFFRNQKLARSAEAEVILTMHRETKEWRVFIPTQLTSAGGVNSVYDPDTIDPNYRVVGTMHSHPGSAFHSGTDTADADNMNGLHLTLGYLDRPTPEVVAMMSVNKQKFHYKDTTIVADFSDLTDASHPEWWDRYIGGHSDKPVGFELFEKFKKPTEIKTETYNRTQNGQSSWVPKPYVAPSSNGKTPTSIVPYESRILTESEEFNSFLAMNDDEWDTYMKARYGDQHSWGPPSENRLVIPPNSGHWAKKHIDDDKDELFSDIYWEETLPVEQVRAILNSAVMTDEDFDYALDFPEKAQYTEYWRGLFMTKMQDIIETLESLGVTMTYQMVFDFSNDNADTGEGATAP